MTYTLTTINNTASNISSVNTQARNSLVMITGATGGLGKAFAVECASRGWNLFLTDMRQDALDLLASGLRRTYGISAWSMACDLIDPAARARLFECIQGDGVQLQGLVNVAGTDYEGAFFDRSCGQINTIIQLNIEAMLEITHRAMVFRDPLAPFHIVNVASLAAFYPMPHKATYAASKRFVVDFSLALRSELRDMGATVTVLCPAGLPTNRECIEAIDAQGIMGLLTTQNIGTVANEALNAALNGKALCIPGRINRLLQTMGSLVPTGLVAEVIGNRWKSVRSKRSAQLLLQGLSQA